MLQVRATRNERKLCFCLEDHKGGHRFSADVVSDKLAGVTNKTSCELFLEFKLDHPNNRRPSKIVRRVVKVQAGLIRIIETARELGHDLKSDSIIMDFGCGAGDNVQSLIECGYNAFGCDLAFKKGVNVERLSQENKIRKVEQKPYRLPFEDDTFDFIFSSEVFEHVQDYSTALAELHRVLKPGGGSVHFFPSRYRPIETHIFVPFASFIQYRWWLVLWAKVGVRNSFQAEMGVQEVVDSNVEFLRDHTTYYSKSVIRRHVLEHFNNCYFCELEAVKHTPRLRSIFFVLKYVPFIAAFLSAFGSRALYFNKAQ